MKSLQRFAEVFEAPGEPRPPYQRLLQQLSGIRPQQMRELGERMEATMREMGAHYGSSRPSAPQPWICDILPHVFGSDEWTRIAAGVQQRLRAFEFFLQDVYDRREILRSGVVPIHVVLGSQAYQSASIGLPRPHGAHLHLCGVCLVRDANGLFAVKEHQFSRASGIAYMMQNRRALARMLPDLFAEASVSSLADTPVAISDALRAAAPAEIDDPSVILLSSGPASADYFEHSFLARRMGIPLVQGGDLLVLDDRLYLKTVRGLKRVDVVYNRMSEEFLDPLVLRKGPLGVPGLVHCLRRGTVSLLNAIGSQLADDRALLNFGSSIIRYYLQEEPILPTVSTSWLGDIDQREMVLDQLSSFRIQPISGGELPPRLTRNPLELAQVIRKNPANYVAQAADPGALSTYFDRGKAAQEAGQQHLVFALRAGDGFTVFPGALTRVLPGSGDEPALIGKDAWVTNIRGDLAAPAQGRPRRLIESGAPAREVTSRVAEAFYWLGRYLERAYHQAYLIQVIETLETEELNSAERKLYQPMWNRLLPPLEVNAGKSRRSITTRLDRYRLLLLPEPGSVASTFTRVLANAESIQESLSPEASTTLGGLRSLFQRTRFRTVIGEEESARIALRLTAEITQRIPQFFAIASRTMLGDDGWRFCEVGEKFERALITANSIHDIGAALARVAQPTEIQLSAVLRLLGTRDAYRRIFQTRAEPIPLLELLWQHPEAPRSVLRCLTCCRDLLRESASTGSAGASKALSGLEELIQTIRRIDWNTYLPAADEEDFEVGVRKNGRPETDALLPLLGSLLEATSEVHYLISDGFLSHQAYIAQTVQPLLQGFGHGI